MKADYPEYAEIDGEMYKINTDYEYSIACFDVVDSEEISDTERALAIVSVLFGKEDAEGNITGIPENVSKAFEIATKFLLQGKDPKENKISKRDMDFNYDKDLISASFMSDYGLDMDNTEMHYWKYCKFISGLTNKSILNRIRDLRNTDLSMYKDRKTKEKLREAMLHVALPNKHTKLNDEDQEALDEFEAFFS